MTTTLCFCFCVCVWRQRMKRSISTRHTHTLRYVYRGWPIPSLYHHTDTDDMTPAPAGFISGKVTPSLSGSLRMDAGA